MMVIRCLRVLRGKTFFQCSSSTKVVCCSRSCLHMYMQVQNIHLGSRRVSPLCSSLANIVDNSQTYRCCKFKNLFHLERKISTKSTELEGLEETFKNDVYVKLKQDSATPSDVYNSFVTFVQNSINSTPYFMRKVVPGYKLGVANSLTSMEESQELMSYFAKHINHYTPNEQVDIFYRLEKLRMEHPLLLDLETMFMDPKYPHALEFSSIGKLCRLSRSHNHSDLVFCRSILPKLQVFFEGSSGFSQEENKKELNAIYSMRYFFDSIKPEWVLLMAQKTLSVISCEGVLNNSIDETARLIYSGIVTVLMLNMSTIRSEPIVRIIYHELAVLFDKHFDQFSLTSAGILALKYQLEWMTRKFHLGSLQYHTVPPLSVEKVKNLVYKTLNEERYLSVEEVLGLMSCVMLVQRHWEHDTWFRLQHELKSHLHDLHIGHVHVLVDIFVDNLPPFVWQNMRNVCSDIVYNYLQKLTPESHKDGLPITEDFIVSCGHYLTLTYYKPHNFFLFIKNKLMDMDKQVLRVGLYPVVQNLLIMIPVFTFMYQPGMIPENVFKKSLSVLPLLKVPLLMSMIKVVDHTANGPKSIVAQRQIMQLQTACYVNLMRTIENTDMQELILMVKSLTHNFRFQHYTAEERLFERLEEECSLDPNRSSEMKALLVTFSRKKCNDSYRPKLVEFFANYFLQNQHTIDNYHFLMILNIVKCGATHLPCQEEFIATACSVVEDNFDQFTLTNQIFVLWLLSHLQVFPTECLMKVFSLDYLAKLDSFLMDENEERSVKTNVALQMMELNRSVILDCPELKLMWLEEPFVDGLQPDDKAPISGNAVPYNQMELQILLEEVMGGENYVQANVRTYYLYDFDFECLILPSEKKAVSYSNVQDYEDSDSLQRIAINYLNTTDYFKFSRKQKSKYQTKKRHLQLLGYRVVEIPHYEWNSMALSKKEDAKDYLREKIFGW